MPPTIFRVILQVGDVQRAARFYETLLDSEGRRVSPGRHYFDCGGTILACFDPRADGDPFDAAPSVDHIYIAVDDLEAAYTAAKRAGATFPDGEVHGTPAGQIATRPWGERSFYVKDPFGNQLCFVDRKTSFTG